MAKQQCSKCGKQFGGFSFTSLQSIKGDYFCSSCAQEYVRDAIASVQITTTHTIEGHRVVRYLDIESVEIVVGTGMFSEFGGDVADFFGARSTAFEKKLQKAKRTALDKLRYLAFDRGGNAVLGVDLDYTEFSGNRIGLIANGTIVRVEPIEPQN